jgi:hypothetical protein
MTWKLPTVSTIVVVLSAGGFILVGSLMGRAMYQSVKEEPLRLGAVPEPVRFADFDPEKKKREIWWCEGHGGVAAMTFTRDRSNVICLRREAVIELPGGDYDLGKKTEEYIRKSRELDRLKGKAP